MKRYVYIVKRRKHDTNGNPRNLIAVYRVQRNILVHLASGVDIGYRDNLQAACDIITDTERLRFGPNEVPEKYSPRYRRRRAGVSVSSGASYSVAGWRHRENKITVAEIGNQ